MKFKVLKLVEKLEEDNIFGQETPDETKAKLDSTEKGLYSESVDDKISDLAREVQAFMQDFDTYDYNDNYSNDEEAYEDAIQSLAHPESRKQVVDRLNEIIQEDNTQEIKDKAQELLNKINELKDEDFYNESVMTEDVDTGKDEENDSAEEIADDMQDETGAEEEEKDSQLDAQLEDLREVLPDLDLNLYQVTNKEDTNKIFYFIGKVADDSNDILMLVDKNPSEDDEEPSVIINEIPLEDNSNEVDDLEDTEVENQTNTEDDESKEERFDFVKIPRRYDDLATMSPRYGDELNPNHEDIMEYLMRCLVKVNPNRAEEINSEKDIDDGDAKIPLDPDVQADIDNKIEHYNKKLNQ